MSKIELSQIASGYNLSAINSNFQQIEDELNNKVFYRTDVGSEPNAIGIDVDMNGKRLFNLPVPILDSEPLRKGDITGLTSVINAAQVAAATAELKAEEAAQSAQTAEIVVNSIGDSVDQAAAYAAAAESSSRLTVGTVTTGAAGSSAAVTISGTPGTQAISFTIPQGIQGIQGPQGIPGAGAGDMIKSVYDPNDDGKVTSAVNADVAPWAGITGKPSTFTPATHTHVIADVTGLQTALDAKQVTIVSGTHIKTVNGSSIVGSGDLEVGYKNVPQNSQAAAYTLVLADSGKHILHPSADTTARTFTIPANASVAFPIGTAITFVNQNAGGVVTIAITTDTMRLAGAGTTGSRTLAANGLATALKIATAEWIISGTGLT